MGYWVCIWVIITLEEQFIFRKDVYDWEVWNDRTRLPLGLAALAAFGIGWVGAIMGMDQVYYIGPIAGMVGEYGADLGLCLGCSFAAVVFPPLRWAELKRFGR
jgi:purine-cytosine permease-like protein